MDLILPSNRSCVAVRAFPLTVAVCSAVVAALLVVASPDAFAAPSEFTRDVLPVLTRHCTRCHGPDEGKSGLRLHTADAVRKGGVTEGLIIAGDSHRSVLIRRLLGLDGDDRMPPKGDPLPAADLAVLRAWVDAGAVLPVEEAPVFAPAKAGLRRLTDDQYRHAIRDLFGVVVDEPMHPGDDGEEFASVRAYRATTSAWSVEVYRDNALLIARKIFGSSADLRDPVVGCHPRRGDDACARSYLERLGRRLWRRPMAADEVRGYLRLAARVAASLRSPWAGLEAATGALLQSPHFLYAWESGVPEGAPPVRLRLGGYEIATRLALFLWNTIPDEALLDAAATGSLDTAAGVRAAAGEMLKSLKAREGVSAFFTEWLELGDLGRLAKDRALYPGNTATIVCHRR